MRVYSDNFQKIAEALLLEYTSVYYVNAITNEYQWYSANHEFHSLQIEQGGEDFFLNLVRDADKVIYAPDKYIFMRDLQKENLLAWMKHGSSQRIEYRLMINGKPVWHALSLIRGVRGDEDYFVLGVKNVDEEVQRRVEAEKNRVQREIYNQIAASLAAHYETLYYVDAETGKFFEVSSNELYKSMGVPAEGPDFFGESRKNILRIVHPDDREFVYKLHIRENNLRNMEEKSNFSCTYRLVIGGIIGYYRYVEIWASDHKHLIIGIENVDDEVNAQLALAESRQKSMTYEQIAESLASHYDVLYYVNAETGAYAEYTVNALYNNLDIQEEGKDFFADAYINCELLLHPDDRARLQNILNKDYFITVLEGSKQYSADYRLITNKEVHYTRMTVMWASDRTHFIIGVENIDQEILREQARIQALNNANELARRDELTGTKNKNAFQELEKSIQQSIENAAACGSPAPFALVVCDINNLKAINDTKGHKAGDAYICAASKLVCHIFAHSPVYRIGGDEFVAFLQGSDYDERTILMEKLRAQVLENMHTDDQPVVAAGFAEYHPAEDTRFSQVFDRADAVMYENKTRLKEGTWRDGDEAIFQAGINIPEERKYKLDALYESFATVAEGAYVFICDIRYDYSRWSKAAVDTFGMTSEYMIGAGDVWAEHIHPDDRHTYFESIADLFSGRKSGHDMQYRARLISGEYVVCTCRGTVLVNTDGAPEYFAGAIRNHSMHGQVDVLTGFRNQYGFFADLESGMLRHRPMRIGMVGISKFSEINEMYGYHFGNRVLQTFARWLFDEEGKDGSLYRLDGTKFAVISGRQTADEMRRNYEKIRAKARGGLMVEGRNVLLDLNCGMLAVDNYDIDYQTVYACLNFAYNTSKVRMQGDMVEFYNNLSDENKHRIEKLHAIRASIMQQYHGFYLVYQPVVDARSERLIGAEALLRWKSEEYGMVPPDHFIPILEKDPFFCDLGEWILRTAIKDAMKILPEFPDFVINVNIAYTQLEKNDFVDMVLGVLQETGFPSDHLCLEITERCRLLDMEHLKNVVVNLRGRGVLIALDDFGTGFSSVGVVKNLPFDIIKIDRSFVRRIEEDEQERELIKSFAGVASTFGAKVCVEGVETAGMRDILQHYSVRSFQGYYYSKPIELPAFMDWSAHRRRNQQPEES